MAKKAPGKGPKGKTQSQQQRRKKGTDNSSQSEREIQVARRLHQQELKAREHQTIDVAQELVEQEKFNAAEVAIVQPQIPEQQQPTYYNLPEKYHDNKLVLMPRDPWWLCSYWDFSGQRIDEVVALIPQAERTSLATVVRVYDVTQGIESLLSSPFFDVDISLDACNWYIHVNQPQRQWCVEVGFRTLSGVFFPIARSNIVGTPYFGVSSIIDEEWAIADDEYFKLLGLGAFGSGHSSLSWKQQLQERLKQQISSPPSSWSESSPMGRKQDNFFLEVWTEIIVYGRTHANAQVTIEGSPVQVRPDGTFSLRYALPAGDFTFDVTATSADKKFVLKKMPAVTRYSQEGTIDQRTNVEETEPTSV